MSFARIFRILGKASTRNPLLDQSPRPGRPSNSEHLNHPLRRHPSDPANGTDTHRCRCPWRGCHSMSCSRTKGQRRHSKADERRAHIAVPRSRFRRGALSSFSFLFFIPQRSIEGTLHCTLLGLFAPRTLQPHFSLWFTLFRNRNPNRGVVWIAWQWRIHAAGQRCVRRLRRLVLQQESSKGARFSPFTM